MRRKNRKWVALAVGLYLFILYSAARWSIHQRLPGEPNILVKHDREVLARMEAEKAKHTPPPPQPTGEMRLTAAGPTYIAARYDDSHVAFIVVSDTESRFHPSPLMRSALTKISTSPRPYAPLAGLQELWQPDNQSLHFFPKVIQTTNPGDQWNLNISPELTIPVSIERPIVAPTGCSLALGFLASIPGDQQKVFTATRAEYFAVRRNAVEPADPQVHSHIAEIRPWKVDPTAANAMQQQLTDRMHKELNAIDASLRANAGTPGAMANDVPVARPYPRLKEWLHADHGLLQGEGQLNYDVHAYKLSPDSTPRLFVRARWTLSGANVFLMTAWFKDAQPPTLLSADSSWSKALREGEAPGSIGDDLDFETILNQFDADHDGWAELLIHNYTGTASVLGIYLYTDQGLVPMKTPLTHTSDSAASCLDP
jgi:hypothetical protein